MVTHKLDWSAGPQADSTGNRVGRKIGRGIVLYSLGAGLQPRSLCVHIRDSEHRERFFAAVERLGAGASLLASSVTLDDGIIARQQDCCHGGNDGDNPERNPLELAW